MDLVTVTEKYPLVRDLLAAAPEQRGAPSRPAPALGGGLAHGVLARDGRVAQKEVVGGLATDGDGLRAAGLEARADAVTLHGEELQEPEARIRRGGGAGVRHWLAVLRMRPRSSPSDPGPDATTASIARARSEPAAGRSCHPPPRSSIGAISRELSTAARSGPSGGRKNTTSRGGSGPTQMTGLAAGAAAWRTSIQKLESRPAMAPVACRGTATLTPSVALRAARCASRT